MALADVIQDYSTVFRSEPNVLAWNCRMSHAWLQREKQNVLHFDNALISQRRGVFVDHRGLFAHSNLSINRVNDAFWEANFYARREFGWRAFEEGDASGAILVCLQCECDSSVVQGFLPGQSGSNRTHEFLKLIKQYLPAKQVIVRTHPREPIANLPVNCIDPAWTWTCDGAFHSVLPHCRAVVTINSTCAHEAVLAGVPVATVGTGTFTGWGVTLECADDITKLSHLAGWRAPQDRARAYVSRAMTRHFLPYDVTESRYNGELQSWMEACQ